MEDQKEDRQGQKERFFAETEELVESYIRDRLLLARMEAAEKGSKLAAHFITGLLLSLVFLLILLFLSLMAGYYFSELTGSQFYGFGIVAGFYIIVAIILLIVRKRYIFPYLINKIINTLFDQINDDDGQSTTITPYKQN
jgi:hypothetical protein